MVSEKDGQSRRDFLKRVLPASALMATGETLGKTAHDAAFGERELLIKIAHYISENTYIIEGTGAGRYAYAYDLAILLSGRNPVDLYKPQKLGEESRTLMNECSHHIRLMTDNPFSATHDADMTRFADFLHAKLTELAPEREVRGRIVSNLVDMVCLSAAQKGLENIAGSESRNFWYTQIAEVARPLRSVIFGKRKESS